MNVRLAPLLLPFVVLATRQSLPAQDSSFILKTTALQPYFSTYLGNGYWSITSSPLGTDARQSFMARVYDHGKGDVPRIAALPAWNEINISNGLHWLNETPADAAHLRGYRQVLNMREGTMTTAYRWQDGARATGVEVQAFVSREARNLAAVRVTVRPGYSGHLTLSFPLTSWPEPKRSPLEELDSVGPGVRGQWPGIWYAGHMTATQRGVALGRNSGTLWLLAQADGRPTQTAEAVTVGWPSGLRGLTVDTAHTAAGSTVVLGFDVSAGKAYSFVKFAAAYSSLESRAPLDDARRASADAQARGYARLFAENARAWRRVWETDILAQGNPRFQRVIHSMIFYLLASVREGTEFGIPPMGLSSPGYYGHIFWDSDTWMFPPLAVMHPAMARSLVMFRRRTLEAARENAERNGQRGAMYPWESDEEGNETTPRFAGQNARYENHVVGDVALAQWQYFLATGDTAWLAHAGYDVLEGTADFWAGRATFDSSRNRYDIKNVVSVDEGLIGISNDTYTNAVATKNLELAARAAEVLHRTPDPRWRAIASRLVIPFDSARQYHPTYEGVARGTLGSVGPLLSYPLGYRIGEQARRNDLLQTLARSARDGPGAMMTETLYPLEAAELGDRRLFDSLVGGSYEPWLKPPFNVLSETPRNVSVNFLTGAGGFLQQVIYGYTGLRLTEEGLVERFPPMLPRGISRLVLRNFSVRGRRLDIEVENGKVTFHSR